ncbi:MAG: tetratricopeptide repeat protein [Acidobacteria bacterium]|nr:tetratricopeptide repeat protein [Acidobacteriota bacterium]
MASHSVSYLSKSLLSILFIGALVLSPSIIRAQEPTEEEYNALTAIQNEKEVGKKIDLIFAFLKEKPKSSYKEHVMAEYQRIIIEFRDAKRWNEIISLGDRFLDVAPGDDFTEKALVVAYAETNNMRGFATYGEKAYAQKPTAALALAIAQAYQKIGNDAKYNQWREKVLAQDPNNIEILIDMTRRYMASQNTAQAVKYAKQTLSALPKAKKPEGVSDKDWKNTTDAGYATAYAVLGANAYQNQSYAEAVRNFENSVKYFKRNDSAYYHLGLCYWQQNKLQPAMLNFAKAYVIKGSTSSSAKKYLDQLYRSSNRNSLAGIERVIERAQQDLR